MADKSETKSPLWLTGFVFIALFAFILASGAPLAAFVTQYLWGWFAVPLGAPAIGFWHAMGIDMAVTFVASPGPGVEPPGVEAMEKLKVWARNLYVRPMLALGIGWLIARIGGFE